MNNKEKAAFLVDEFSQYAYCFLGSGMLTNTFSPEVSLMNSKLCAVKCVIEKIESLDSFAQYWDIKRGEWYLDELEKLNDLKKEIERL